MVPQSSVLSPVQRNAVLQLAKINKKVIQETRGAVWYERFTKKLEKSLRAPAVRIAEPACFALRVSTPTGRTSSCRRPASSSSAGGGDSGDSGDDGPGGDPPSPARVLLFAVANLLRLNPDQQPTNFRVAVPIGDLLAALQRDRQWCRLTERKLVRLLSELEVYSERRLCDNGKRQVVVFVGDVWRSMKEELSFINEERAGRQS